MKQNANKAALKNGEKPLDMGLYKKKIKKDEKLKKYNEKQKILNG